jgi:hypothetical protein
MPLISRAKYQNRQRAVNAEERQEVGEGSEISLLAVQMKANQFITGATGKTC